MNIYTFIERKNIYTYIIECKLTFEKFVIKLEMDYAYHLT